MASSPKDPAKVITPEAILSYPWIWKPQPADKEGGKPKYGAMFVFLAGADLAPIKAALLFAAKEKFGESAEEMIRAGKIEVAFHKGEKKDLPAGSYYLNARSEQQPGVVGAEPDPNDSTKARKITAEAELYPGCIVRASLRAYGYDWKGKKGVTFGLNNIQKLRDGPRLDGRKQAQDEFEPDLSIAPPPLPGDDGDPFS